MLSKAEVMYLQGQKKVSGSYERKLKCLIRKKVENLKNELPLLSKVFPIADLFGYDNKDGTKENLQNPIVVNNANHATKFSNSEVQNNETAIGSATEFRNTADLQKQASTRKNINHGNREVREGSNASSINPDKQEMAIKHKKNSNSVSKAIENQRRERDSNPRDLAVTSFL